MDKKKLVQAYITQLESELAGIKSAAMATLEAATHEETKPENEYDTFALEASYLAGAQAKRAGEIDEILSMFSHIQVRNFSKNDSVSATALVEVLFDGKKKWVFLMPKGGGFSLSFEGKNIQVVTPGSHLGEALLDRKVDEEFEVEMGDQIKEYQVLQIL
ncbi:MAG: hypothetical protein AB7H97_01160 [Pseudobdellovibrionaceae bacterium]